MADALIEMGVTCGIEFETEQISPNEFKTRNDWRTTHDASIESDKKYTSSNLVLNKIDENLVKIIPYRNIVVGTELVSSIFNSESEDFESKIKHITSILSSLGEEKEGERGGIHYHFSLPSPNLRILKSLLRVGKYLESTMFTLGGMGYRFRGENNDSIYFRPITKFGPVCIPYYSDYSQIFNIYDLLLVKKQEEFWEKYGDLRNHGGTYNPVRYHWLNLYPLCPFREYRGTVEFRVFNKTLNPYFILATLALCKAITRYAIKSSFETLKEDKLLEENSIYTISSKYKLFEILENFGKLVELDTKILDTLFKILDITPLPKLEKGYVHTHINRDLGVYWNNSEYYPKIIPIKEVSKPVYTDIHVLRGER